MDGIRESSNTTLAGYCQMTLLTISTNARPSAPELSTISFNSPKSTDLTHFSNPGARALVKNSGSEWCRSLIIRQVRVMMAPVCPVEIFDIRSPKRSFLSSVSNCSMVFTAARIRSKSPLISSGIGPARCLTNWGSSNRGASSSASKMSWGRERLLFKNRPTIFMMARLNRPVTGNDVEYVRQNAGQGLPDFSCFENSGNGCVFPFQFGQIDVGQFQDAGGQFGRRVHLFHSERSLSFSALPLNFCPKNKKRERWSEVAVFRHKVSVFRFQRKRMKHLQKI